LGPYKEYNEKGVLIEESNFYDDSLHGEQRLYDDNGKLKQVRTYYYGLLLEVK
jgi:antitoxin component YwqK of YwqJK toxin-antitoxin module